MNTKRFAAIIPVLVLGLFFTISSPAHATYKPGGITYLPFMGIGTGSSTPLGITNTKALTYSFWLMGTYDSGNNYSLRGNQFLSDEYSWCEVTGGGAAPGLCGSADSPSGLFQMSFNDATGTVAGVDDIKFEAQVPSNAAWHHYLVSMDSDSAHSATGLGALYIDGALFTANGAPQVSLNAIPDLNNALGFHIPGSAMLQYESDVVAAETSVVCTGVGTPASMNGITVTCAGANTIPPEILSKFIGGAGRPVDLGTGCSTPFGGRTAEVCVTGSTPANTGSGASIAPEIWGTGGQKSGEVPDYGGVYTAPFGPWGIPDHQATMRWVTEKQPATVTQYSTTRDSYTTYGASNPVYPGDLLVILAAIGSAGTIGNAHMSCPSGFSTVGPVLDTGYPAGETNSVMCYKFATATSTTAAYTVVFDHGTASRSHDYLMADYTNVASVDQKGSIYNGHPQTTTHLTASSLTTTAPNETVVSAWANWDAQVNQFLLPASGTLRFRLPDNIGSPMQLMLVDEYSVASSSNPQRTMTTATTTDNIYSNAHTSSAGYTLTLIPN